MLVILEKVVLAILLLFFGAVTVTNPWGLDAIQRVTLALAAFLAMICVAYTINKNKIELPPSSAKSLPAPELPKKDEPKKTEPKHTHQPCRSRCPSLSCTGKDSIHTTRSLLIFTKSLPLRKLAGELDT
jgi:hypothetical protein